MSSLAILGSGRSGGHTAAVLQHLVAGSDCEIVDLHRCKIELFRYSQEPTQDEFTGLVERIVGADLTIFATPVYWYSYSAIMKNFIDRFSDLLIDNQDLVDRLRGKDFVLLSSGAVPEPEPALELAFEKFCGYFGANCVARLYARREDDFFDPKAADLVRRRLKGLPEPRRRAVKAR